MDLETIDAIMTEKFNSMPPGTVHRAKLVGKVNMGIGVIKCNECSLLQEVNMETGEVNTIDPGNEEVEHWSWGMASGTWTK